MDWKTALLSTVACATVAFSTEAQTRPNGHGIGPGKSVLKKANDSKPKTTVAKSDSVDHEFCVDPNFMESFYQKSRYKKSDMNDLRQIKLDSTVAYLDKRLGLIHAFAYMSVPKRDNCAGYITTEYVDWNRNNCLDSADIKMSESLVVHRLGKQTSEIGVIVHDLREDTEQESKLHFGIQNFDRVDDNWRATINPVAIAQKCEAPFKVEEANTRFKENVALMVQRPTNGLNQIWDRPIFHTARKLQGAKPAGQN